MNHFYTLEIYYLVVLFNFVYSNPFFFKYKWCLNKFRQVPYPVYYYGIDVSLFTATLPVVATTTLSTPTTASNTTIFPTSSTPTVRSDVINGTVPTNITQVSSPFPAGLTSTISTLLPVNNVRGGETEVETVPITFPVTIRSLNVSFFLFKFT